MKMKKKTMFVHPQLIVLVVELVLILKIWLLSCSSSSGYTTAAAAVGRQPSWSRIATLYLLTNTSANSTGKTTSMVRLWTPPDYKVRLPKRNSCSSWSRGSTHSFDLGTAREWMEYVARIPNNTFGAYTVLRCEKRKLLLLASTATDPTTQQQQQQQPWKLWGLDFHLNRLKESFSSMVTSSSSDDYNFDLAYHQTHQIIQKLLFDADNTITTTNNNNTFLMLTVLWTPKQVQEESNNRISTIIEVSGHARHIPNYSRIPPPPIVAMISIPATTTTILPRRYDRIPEAKLSSWCYERRILEKEYKIKYAPPPAEDAVVGEVLLTRPSLASSSNNNIPNEDMELLEGLTTNLFVFYQDGTLRTAPDGILPGYVRHLILQQCHHDIPIILNPPRLSEANLWKEVFISSSIQLLCPVQKVLMPVAMDNTTTNNNKNKKEKFVTVWEDKNNEGNRLVDKIFLQLIKDGRCHHIT